MATNVSALCCPHAKFSRKSPNFSSSGLFGSTINVSGKVNHSLRRRIAVVQAKKLSPAERAKETSVPEAGPKEPPPPPEMPVFSPSQMDDYNRLMMSDEPDFWEGPQWNTLGFIAQYLWAFGILVSLIACAVAVATYNGGASDFRETNVYKEAMKTQEGEFDITEGIEFGGEEAPVLTNEDATP